LPGGGNVFSFVQLENKMNTEKQREREVNFIENLFSFLRV
jgi:hypothetical protein